MHDVMGTLGGFRGVRAQLLVVLKKEQPLTASELASRFGLTANALRRHLKVLEEDGVVQYQRVVRGVGAPVFAYRLSETGEAVFPRRYASMLTSALEALKAERGNASVSRVLRQEWDELVTEAAPVLEGLPLSERVALVAELLTARGYMAEREDEKDGGAALRIHNCAMCGIVEQFPEACDVEAEELSRLLGASITRLAHRLNGESLCSYKVSEHLENTDYSSAVGVSAPRASEATTYDGDSA